MVNSEGYVFDQENAFRENLFFADWLRFFESQNPHFLKNKNRSAAIAAAKRRATVVAMPMLRAAVFVGREIGLHGIFAHILTVCVFAVAAWDAGQNKQVQTECEAKEPHQAHKRSLGWFCFLFFGDN